MNRSAMLCTILLFGAGAFATYDKFHYTTEATNWLCPGMAWSCIAPSICAYDGLTDLYNCCDTDAEDAVCWNNSTPCEEEEGGTPLPGSNQIGCSSGANAFCCLKGRESCTQRFEQINVCWELADDPFRNVSQARMNATFSSLSSASPSASALTVADIAVLIATSAPFASTKSRLPSRSTATTSPTSASLVLTSTTNTASTKSEELKPKTSFSGGAIGGTVVGAVAGMALIGGGFFFLFRRRRGSHAAPKGSKLEGHGPTDPHFKSRAHVQPVTHEKYAHEVAGEASSKHSLQELPGNSQRFEMEGSRPVPPKVAHSFV